MKEQVGQYPIVEKKNLAKNCWSFQIHCPEIVKEAQPGQFVQVKADGFFLRRPISICELNKTSGNLRIVFEIRGSGTKVLSELATNACMDLLGPLGSGFSLLSPNAHAIVVGGGIGTPPLLEAIKHYENGTAILGFRSKDAVLLEPDYNRSCAKTILCTDDGTAGQKGFVTDALKRELDENPTDIVYACGPKIMLKKVALLCKERHVRCEVSMEERMACGVGTCLGCAIACQKDGETHYARVCKDGPVFNAEEVVWDD